LRLPPRNLMAQKNKMTWKGGKTGTDYGHGQRELNTNHGEGGKRLKSRQNMKKEATGGSNRTTGTDRGNLSR